MRCYFIILAAVLFSSCSKWLDVKPETQVEKDELFQTEAGFEDALNGVYARGAKSDLYGGELSFGFLDVLAQNYTIPSVDYLQLKNYQTSIFNYKDVDFVRRKDSVWAGLYNAISNCNLILENIEAKKQILGDDYYSLIKGEALGLRAYFHFDLLRLFAPSYASNAGAPAIPYVTTFSNRITPLSTVSEAVDKVIADLTEAKALLKTSDPIVKPPYVVGLPGDEEETETASNTLFLQNRRHRMNYYAVCAELARAYLYKSDKPKALSNALEVIDSNKFPWADGNIVLAPDERDKDRIFYTELIFAWYIPNMQFYLRSHFSNGDAGLFIEENAGEALYEKGTVGGEDYRFKEWLRLNRPKFEIQKYQRDDTGDPYLYPQVAPALRLSEVCYIAAEATYDTDPARALSYIDSVRYHRGIGTPLAAATKEVFLEELLKESRKEFYAEGQIFYSYKRLNRAIVGQAGASIPASDKIFVLPLPDSEIEFGGR